MHTCANCCLVFSGEYRDRVQTPISPVTYLPLLLITLISAVPHNLYHFSPLRHLTSERSQSTQFTACNPIRYKSKHASYTPKPPKPPQNSDTRYRRGIKNLPVSPVIVIRKRVIGQAKHCMYSRLRSTIYTPQQTPIPHPCLAAQVLSIHPPSHSAIISFPPT